jgi:ketosteroid isomerase-like protein
MLTSVVWCSSSSAQNEDPVHNELRKVRNEMMEAFKARDIERLLSHLHPNAVVTWQNAEVSHGRDGVKQYYQKMMVGEDSRVKSVTADLAVDDLSILYGDDTAIAYGTLSENFVLRSGLSFDLGNRWTATLVRGDGEWLVAAFHVSTNMFENGLQDRLLQWNTIKSGGIALVIGALLGILIKNLLGRRKAGRAQEMASARQQ